MIRDACNTHCTTCGRCFSGTIAFDAHRAGTPDTRHCVNPALVRDAKGRPVLVPKTPAGRCSLGNPPQEMIGVVVWQLAAVAERFAA